VQRSIAIAMDEKFMSIALAEAKRALAHDDVPVGAVIVKNGAVLAKAHNLKERKNLCTAHAEIIAIERASRKLGTWYLDGCEMYVTLEPCAMCAGALINSRIDRLYFGAFDSRFGCTGSIYNLPADTRFNHRLEVKGGVMQSGCAELLKAFFKTLRE